MIMASQQADNFDQDLFSLVWGPTLAALCYVFDKSRFLTRLTLQIFESAFFKGIQI
jgi:hypothetical protein